MAFLGFFPQSSIASDLGQALGGGLSKGLNALAEHKVNKLQTSQRENQLLTAGFDAQTARTLAPLYDNPQVQKAIAENKLGQQAEEEYARLLGGGGAQQNQPVQQHGQVQQPGQTGQPQMGQVGPQQEQKARLTGQQATKLKEFQLQEQKIAQRGQEFAQNLIKGEVESLREKYNALPAREQALDTIIATAKSGKLRGKAVQGILNKLGLSDVFTGNLETQLAQSAMNRLVTNAGNAFNTRNLTNLDVGLYKRVVPSLLNSDEGKIAIAKNMKLEDEADKLRYLEYKKLSQKGFTPDLLERVDDAIAPKLKKLADKAITNVVTVDFPDSSAYEKGAIVRDPDSGYVFRVTKEPGNEYELVSRPGEENAQTA